MDENEVLMPDENPDYDPEEWERKRKEEWERKMAGVKALREQINDHDDLLADTLYELTLIELGIDE